MFLQSRNLIIAAASVMGCGIAAMVVAHDRGVTAAAPEPVNPPYVQAAQQAPPTQSPDDGYYPAFSRPVYVQPPAPEYVAPAPVYSNQGVVYEKYREHHRHHGRSKAHSVEIVAGTAGVGAAIGAIAGGGPGAAIGAIAGGSGGFAYDRLTH